MTTRYDPERQRRRSIRLKRYDYSQTGAYFVTIVAQGQVCLSGEVVGEDMQLNEAGAMVCQVWEALPLRFPGTYADAFVVMPNHIHGIIAINQPVGAPLVGAQSQSVGVQTPADALPSAGDGATTRVAPTLGDVIGAYKSLTTVRYVRGVNMMAWPPFQGRLWQRNYYERVIRNEDELGRVREYIVNNPLKWELDSENPARLDKP